MARPCLSAPYRWARAIWRYAGAVSVRTKILGIVLGLVLLLGFGATWQVRIVSRQALLSELAATSISVARDVAGRAADLILINDLFALHRLLEETQLNNPDVRYAFILDTQGQVLAHTFGAGFPLELLRANSVAAAEHHQTLRLTTDEGMVWDTAVPVFEGRAGIARVGLSETGAQGVVDTLTGQMLVTIAVVSSAGIAAAAFLTWVVTRPILQLKEAAQAVGQGDFSQRVLPWAGDEIGELAQAFNVMTDQLAQADQARLEREQVRTQLLEKVIAAQEDERRRIARELHDETGQALTSLLVRLQIMSEQASPPEMKPQIQDLRQVVGETLANVRSLAVELRPSVLDDLGLTAALERYIRDYEARHALEVDLVVLGLEERLSPAVETALYRIVQESLTNIARHAQATSASILLERRQERVRAIVEDDGVGFEISAEQGDRLGLYGMRERAELLNGTLTIESAPGRGTSVYVEFPA